MPQLLDLPIEIILHIAESIYSCSRCKPWQFSRGQIVWWYIFYGDRHESASLSSLSKTCRYLRDNIQPVLFRHIYPDHLRLLPLIHDLRQRKDLAECVRELHLCAWDDTLPWMPASSSHMGSLGRLSSLPVEIGHDILQLWPELAQDPVPVATKDREAYAQAFGALCGIALSQTRNLRSLFISVPSWQGVSFPVNSLPLLAELTLCNLDDDFDPYIVDVKGILLAAPNLKILRANDIQGVSHGVQHGGFTALELNSCYTSPSELKAMIRGLDNVQEFTYNCMNPDNGETRGASPREIAEILSTRENMLKRLAIRFCNFFCHSIMYDEDIPQPDPITSLKNMHKLETLSLDRYSICSLPSGRGTCDQDLFVKLLPQSIRRLAILVPGECHIPALLRLAEEARDAFPDLVEVNLRSCPYSEDEMERLRDAYLQKGVCMLFGKISD